MPDEFIAHVRAATPALPKSDWPSSPPDTEFWKDWCHRHRSGQCRQRLADATSRADIEAARLFAAVVAELERKEGLSETRCCWVGCANRALAGRLICAACSLRDQSHVTLPAYAKLRQVLTEGIDANQKTI